MPTALILVSMVYKWFLKSKEHSISWIIIIFSGARISSLTLYVTP